MDASIDERVSRLREAAIFYGLLVVIALTAVPFGTVDPWWESVFEASVFLLVMLAIVDASLSGSRLIGADQLLLPMLAVVVFAVAQSVTFWKVADGPAMAGVMLNRALSADPFETWRFALKMLAVTLTLGLLLRYSNTESRSRAVIYVVVGIALASAVFGLLSTRLPQSWLGLTSNRLAPDRSYGQFENRNHFALLMEMGIGLVLGLSAGNWNDRKRLIIVVLSGLIMWAALLSTHSRGGVLALMVEIPCFVFLYRWFRKSSGSSHEPATKTARILVLARNALLAGLLLSAVAASAVLVGGSETIDRIGETRAEFTPREVGPPKINRPAIWLATLKLIKDHPVAGVGFAAYSVAIPRHLNSSGEWTPEQAHNDYLEVLASGGLIGGVLCVWFLAVFVKAASVRLRSAFDSEGPIKCGALAGLFAVAVHSVFDFGLHVTVNALVCIALISVVLGTTRKVTV